MSILSIGGLLPGQQRLARLAERGFALVSCPILSYPLPSYSYPNVSSVLRISPNCETDAKFSHSRALPSLGGLTQGP